MKKILIALAILIVGDVDAGCRRSFYPSYKRHRNYHYVYRPYVEEVEVTKDYYFSIDSYYRDKLLVDAIVGRLVQFGKGGVIVNPPPTTGQKTIDPRVNQPEVKWARLSQPTPVPDGLEKIVADSCIKCHGSGSVNSDLTNLSTINFGLRWKAHGFVNSGKMPKSSDALKDDQVLAFYNWAEGKAK